MLKKLRNRVASMRGIADLCTRAEAVARNSGEIDPSAEHFVLASLDMADGSAASALAELGFDRPALAEAIREQHFAALAAAGISPEHVEEGQAVHGTAGTALYRATASGQKLMQILSEQAQQRSSDGFQSAHVLEAAAALRHGIVPRALKKLGVLDQLAQTSQPAS